MTTEIQTKRRWLKSILTSVDDAIPGRVFPREIRQTIQLRPTPKAFALRIKMTPRATAAG